MDKMTYDEFLLNKAQCDIKHGFEPVWMPDFLYNFQKHVEIKHPKEFKAIQDRLDEREGRE